MKTETKTTAILGASPKADRYSNMALKRLQENGHPVIPVNPAYGEIEGVASTSSLVDAAAAAGSDGLDTVTVYVGGSRLQPMVDDIISAKPKRVIFNPGTENSEAQAALNEAGIPWIEACTLVLLATKQY